MGEGHIGDQPEPQFCLGKYLEAAAGGPVPGDLGVQAVHFQQRRVGECIYQQAVPHRGRVHTDWTPAAMLAGIHSQAIVS